MDQIRRRIQHELNKQASDSSGENYTLLKNSAYILKTKEANKEKLWGSKQAERQEKLDRILELFPDIKEMYDLLGIPRDHRHALLCRPAHTVWQLTGSRWFLRSPRDQVCPPPPLYVTGAATFKTDGSLDIRIPPVKGSL